MIGTAHDDLVSAVQFVKSRTALTSDVTTAHLFALIIGESGSGKTSLAGTCPNPFIINGDGERGVTTLRRLKLPYVTVGSWAEFRMALRYLAQGDHSYDTIFVDGLSRIQNMMLSYMIEQAGKQSMNMSLWGQAKKKGLLLMDELENIGTVSQCNVLVTCLERIERDEERGVPIRRGPDLQGGLRDQICPRFSEVLFSATSEITVEVEGQEEPNHEIVYRVLTKPYGIRKEAKDRWDVLDAVEMPDVESWLTKIRADLPKKPPRSAEKAPESPPTATEPPTEGVGTAPTEYSAPGGSDGAPDEPSEAVGEITEAIGARHQAIKDWWYEIAELKPTIKEAAATKMTQLVFKAGFEKVTEITDANTLDAIMVELKNWEDQQSEVV
jgi:hypothetical protein